MEQPHHTGGRAAVRDRGDDMMAEETREVETVQQEANRPPEQAPRPPLSHAPEVSVWPLPLAIGVALALVGLAVLRELTGAGIVIALVALVGWLREAREQGETRPALASRYLQVVVFQVMPAAMGGLETPGGLFHRLNEHATDLREQETGFTDMLITRTVSTDGPVLVMVETGWDSAEALAAYHHADPNVEKLVRAADTGLPSSLVEVYDTEVAGEMAG